MLDASCLLDPVRICCIGKLIYVDNHRLCNTLLNIVRYAHVRNSLGIDSVPTRSDGERVSELPSSVVQWPKDWEDWEACFDASNEIEDAFSALI